MAFFSGQQNAFDIYDFNRFIAIKYNEKGMEYEF